jgi:5,10-methylene-tetrahydrofolate dehydrogenase/methenyl tetrahydrofolate cyclohydrolase
MATAASESTKRDASKKQVIVLGRSAATGRVVMLPATNKGATITMREARSAVNAIREKKK